MLFCQPLGHLGSLVLFLCQKFRGDFTATAFFTPQFLKLRVHNLPHKIDVIQQGNTEANRNFIMTCALVIGRAT